MPRELVTLEQAWFWRCPRCRHDNYARSVPPDSLADQPEADLRTALGLESWQVLPENVEGEFVAAPEVVTCANCRAEFDCFEDPDDDVAAENGAPPKVPDNLPEDFDDTPR